jgi:TonB family protein
MSQTVTSSKIGLCFLFVCAASFCVDASLLAPQEGDADARKPAVETASTPTPDFEVKIVPGKEFLVRRKGTLEWMLSSKLSEPVAVGVLDGDHKIYVATKAIKPPKVKHTQSPDYPEIERKSGTEGQATLHVVVDDQGMVRLPTVDSSPGPEFAKAAIEAVKTWTFEPAKLNGQPVAVLIKVEIQFRLFHTPF